MTRRSFESRATREDRPASRLPTRTLSLDDWRERLRTDPRGTVAELLELFAERRSPVPGVEDFFGRVLADHATPPELVRGVVARVRAPVDAEPALGIEPSEPGAPEAEPPGRVLDLDREHRVRLRGRLRVIATELVVHHVRDPGAHGAIAADPMRLAEVAFVHRRRWEDAAALFALEHDHLQGGEHAQALLARASLRYSLARALHRVKGHEERAVRVMEAAVVLAEGAGTGAEGAATWRVFATRLAFHAREWLGLRHYEAGLYRAAEREFLAAVEAAPDTDLALAARRFAANALIRDGRQAEAREIPTGFDPGAAASDEEVSVRWEELRRRLLEGPGEDDPEGGDGEH